MADLNSIPVRWYQDNVDRYTADVDNRPLEDLNGRVNLVNTDLETTKTEVREARGSQSSVGNRLDVSLNDDGTLKSEALTGIPAIAVDEQESVPPVDDDRVWMTRGEQTKLSLITEQANRILLGLNQSEPTDGIVRLVLGNTLRGAMQPSGEGTTIMFLDTVFSGDRLHEHKYQQEFLQYSSGIALFPNQEDDVISGSVRLYLNGQVQSPSCWEEYTDTNTGKVIGVYITEDADMIDLSSDRLWVDYDVRVRLSSESPLSSGISGSSARWEHTIDQTYDLKLVDLPLSSTVQQRYQFWLFDVTELVFAGAYENYMLFVTNEKREDSSGHVFASYGIDWDLITISGNTYLRWRYDRNPGATSGIPDPTSTPDRWEFLVNQGAGTTLVDADKFAPFDLANEAHLDLLYVSGR